MPYYNKSSSGNRQPQFPGFMNRWRSDRVVQATGALGGSWAGWTPQVTKDLDKQTDQEREERNAAAIAANPTGKSSTKEIYKQTVVTMEGGKTHTKVVATTHRTIHHISRTSSPSSSVLVPAATKDTAGAECAMPDEFAMTKASSDSLFTQENVQIVVKLPMSVPSAAAAPSSLIAPPTAVKLTGTVLESIDEADEDTECKFAIPNSVATSPAVCDMPIKAAAPLAESSVVATDLEKIVDGSAGDAECKITIPASGTTSPTDKGAWSSSVAAFSPSTSDTAIKAVALLAESSAVPANTKQSVDESAVYVESMITTPASNTIASITTLPTAAPHEEACSAMASICDTPTTAVAPITEISIVSANTKQSINQDSERKITIPVSDTTSSTVWGDCKATTFTGWGEWPPVPLEEHCAKMAVQYPTSLGEVPIVSANIKQSIDEDSECKIASPVSVTTPLRVQTPTMTANPVETPGKQVMTANPCELSAKRSRREPKLCSDSNAFMAAWASFSSKSSTGTRSPATTLSRKTSTDSLSMDISLKSSIGASALPVSDDRSGSKSAGDKKSDHCWSPEHIAKSSGNTSPVAHNLPTISRAASSESLSSDMTLTKLGIGASNSRVGSEPEIIAQKTRSDPESTADEKTQSEHQSTAEKNTESEPKSTLDKKTQFEPESTDKNKPVSEVSKLPKVSKWAAAKVFTRATLTDDELSLRHPTQQEVSISVKGPAPLVFSDWDKPTKKKTIRAANIREGSTIGGSSLAIGDESKGHAMIRKMGWAPGTGLGSHATGILKPVDTIMRTNKRGLGAVEPVQPVQAPNWEAQPWASEPTKPVDYDADPTRQRADWLCREEVIPVQDDYNWGDGPATTKAVLRPALPELTAQEKAAMNLAESQQLKAKELEWQCHKYDLKMARKVKDGNRVVAEGALKWRGPKKMKFRATSDVRPGNPYLEVARCDYSPTGKEWVMKSTAPEYLFYAVRR